MVVFFKVCIMGNKVDVFASNTSTYAPEQITPNRKYIVTNTVLQHRKTSFNILSSNNNKPKVNELSLSATLSYRNRFSVVGNGMDAEHHGRTSLMNNSSLSQLSDSQSLHSLFNNYFMNNNKSISKHLSNDMKDEYSDEKDESNRFLTFFKRISDLRLASETKEEPVIYISEKLVEILSQFWMENIELKTADVQLVCCLYYNYNCF